MKDLEIRLVRNKNEFNEVIGIRRIVFVKSQRVPLQREMDGLDNEAKHVIVKIKNKTIGCARIRFKNDTIKLERIAVLREYRGKGIGKMLTQYLVSYCKRRKVKEIILHSQYHLKDFYKKFGFKTRGKTFMDAGIKHIEMFMKI